jgi:hypothetical protein
LSTRATTECRKSRAVPRIEKPSGFRTFAAGANRPA